MKIVSTLVVVSLLGAGCASEYTVLDRSSIEVSPASRIAAGSLLPGADKHPLVAQHLALAEEVFGKQLDLLKERRNKVRARRRALTLTSYATMLVGSIVTGYVALAATDKANPSTDLKVVGVTSLGTLGLGTGLQIGALMQEEGSDVDEKIRHLEGIYDGMLERVRTLALVPGNDQTESQMAAAIESFINEALQINVKG
ncbi:MAG TPA: hypothetical protein VGP64_16825 [Polyangia bacterium]|jgi:hypothetical protein